MTLTLIVAMDRNRAIGRDGQVPWRLSGDMRFFKAMTMGKPIIMGRKTWESLGRPLPGRRNVVITRDRDYAAEGAEVVHSPETALALVADEPEAMVIGGAEIYRLFLPRADRIYLTRVDTEAADADAWFPEFDAGSWEEERLGDFPADEKNSSSYSISVLKRISGS